MRMTKRWTIVHPAAARPFKARGDCPVWAADFKGSRTEAEGGQIIAETVAVAGTATRQPCSYCTSMGRPVAHFSIA